MNIIERWNSLPLRFKFFNVFLAIMLLAGGGMFILDNQLLQVVRNNDKIINQSVPNLTTQLQVKSTIMERINYVTLYITTGKEEFRAKFEEASARARKIEDQLKESALPNEKAGIEKFIIDSEDWEIILRNQVIPVYQRNNPKDAMNTLNEKAQPFAIQLMNEVEELSQRKIQAINESNQKMFEDARTSVHVGYVVIGVTLLLALVFSYYMSRSITRPILSLLRGVRRMTQGDFTARVTVASQDEWGEVSKAFNQMSLGIANLVEELRQANVRLREESERAQESTRLKSEFLATMSHELRTPLTGIIGFAELMHEDAENRLSPAQKNFTRNIIKAGEHLLSMINDILDLSKIEAGKYELETTSFDIVEMIRSTLVMMQAKAKQQDIALVLETAYSSLEVHADKTRIRQVLLNLLGNAIKFSPAQSQVRVVLEQSEDVITVRVIDKGIGIEEDKLERIFEQFYQNDGSLERNYEGTGLGLALSKQLIELHGGSMEVKSELGRGSTFSFYLSSCSEKTTDYCACGIMNEQDALLVFYTKDFMSLFPYFSQKINKENRTVFSFVIESKQEAINIIEQYPEYDIVFAVPSFCPAYVEMLEALRKCTQRKIFAYIEHPLRLVERGQIMRVADSVLSFSENSPAAFK
jgi:signal transduction histidine kinase